MGSMASELLNATALLVSQALFLALVPIAVLAGGTRIINGVHDARLRWTPYIELAALWIGIMAGVVIIIHNVDPATLGPTEVLRVGGPWDLTFGEFLAEKANPLRYDISAVLPLPFSGRLPSGWGFAAFFLGGLVIYAPILYFRSRRAVANAIRNAFVMICGAYFTVYGFAYFLWLMNRLNFWIFLVLMAIIHMRSRTERIVLRLN